MRYIIILWLRSHLHQTFKVPTERLEAVFHHTVDSRLLYKNMLQSTISEPACIANSIHRTMLVEELLAVEREPRRARARELFARIAAFPAIKTLDQYGFFCRHLRARGTWRGCDLSPITALFIYDSTDADFKYCDARSSRRCDNGMKEERSASINETHAKAQ